MNYLLDTHAFLWFVLNDKALSRRARRTIEDPANIIYLSMASIWEMAIKVNLGKLTLPSPLTPYIQSEMDRNDFSQLEIRLKHLARVAILPRPRHHKDPFDRLIIAQALCEDFAIITKDTKFKGYDEIQLHW